MASPEVSARCPTAPRSEIVKTPMRICRPSPPLRRRFSFLDAVWDERHLHDLGFYHLSPDIDFNLHTGFGAVLWQVRRPDCHVDGRRNRAAADDVHLRAAEEHR